MSNSRSSIPAGSKWTPGGWITPEEQKLARRMAAAAQIRTTVKMPDDPDLCIFRPTPGSQNMVLDCIAFMVGDDERPAISVDLSAVPVIEQGQGLVLTQPIRVEGLRTSFDDHVDDQELRTGALLWQHIVVPLNNTLNLNPGPDVEFLLREGAATVVPVKLRGRWDAGMAVRDAVFETLEQLRSRDADRWSLAQGERSLTVEDAREDGAAISFRLNGAIPVPDRQVPLDEVLAFRSKRHDELVTLRNSIASVAANVAAETDRPLAEQLAKAKIASAVDDHLKAMREFRFPIRIASVETKIDIKTWSGAVGGFTLAKERPLPLALASGLLGGALASVALKPAWRSHSGSDSPCEYVWRITKSYLAVAERMRDTIHPTNLPRRPPIKPAYRTSQSMGAKLIRVACGGTGR